MSSTPSSATPTPAFQRIKDYVQGEIEAGTWGEGDAIPPELRLAAQFGVSRMTVNRALNELEAEADNDAEHFGQRLQHFFHGGGQRPTPLNWL